MFKFGQRSLLNLEGVNPKLVTVASKAIAISKVDFAIIQGRRTEAEQAANVAKGASQTMDSRHLSGNAIDVAAYLNGKIAWDSYLYIDIAKAFLEASKQTGVPIRWGGSWSLLTRDPKVLMEAYVESRKNLGKKPFLDFGHFEIPA